MKIVYKIIDILINLIMLRINSAHIFQGKTFLKAWKRLQAYRYVVLLAAIVFCFNSLSAQNTKEKAQLNEYIAQGIKNILGHSKLKPFNKDLGKLKLSQIDSYRKKVWGIYKDSLMAIQPLVTPTVVPSEDYAIHRWDLIGEDPLYFRFIQKQHNFSLQRRPLFLALHGSGPKDHEFSATLKWSIRYKDAPSYYFIPQIPNEKRYRWWLKPVQYAWEQLFRLAMVSDSIDVNKLYVMGISEGGYGSQRLGAFYADYLAGAGPMAGGEPLRNAPALNFRNIAFSLQTGSLDAGFGRNVLTKRAKVVFDSLSQLNPGQFIHKIYLQPNKGHHIDYTVTTPWLVQYTRDPHPMHISWVLFPMDGRYRNGFYNIAIEKDLGIHAGDDYDRAIFDITFDRNRNKIFIQANLSTPDLSARKWMHGGRIAIFLDNHYVDLRKKVQVFLNGNRVYNQKCVLTKSNITESCLLFGDPYRLFPAKISIDL